MALADKIVIMRKGKILQIGSPKEVYDHPINPFVASFLGEANFMRVKFEDGKTNLLGHVIKSDLNGNYIACLRPEALHLGTKGTRIKVINCRPFGPFFKYDVDFNGLQLSVRSTHDESSQEHITFEPSDVIYFKEPEEGLEKSLLSN
jgi:ABC-type Fe3+/spermidine/putrescine transport system ATPase subunit